MVKKKGVVIGLAVLCVAASYYYFIYDTPVRQIKKQFAELVEKLEKLPGESPLISAGKAKNASSLFAETCRFDLPAYSFEKNVTPEQLAQYILSFKSRYAQITIRLYDYQFRISDKKTADVFFTAGIWAKGNSGEIQEDIQEFSCRVETIEDDWKFSAVELVEVLEK